MIGQLLAQASKEVIDLDAIVNKKYMRQPKKLRAWQSASRVERAPQREKKAPVALNADTPPQSNAA
jgi:hypothetical protein